MKLIMYNRYKKLIGTEIICDRKKILLTKFVACGGNSVVYECIYLSKKYIIKFFNGKNKKRYQRFMQETEKIAYLNEKQPGFTPFVKKPYFPEYNRSFQTFKVDKSPFYIMEKGDKYNYKNLTFEQKLNDVIELCNTLRIMHSFDIQHRDIKPENILKYNGHLTYIDYGTARVPNIETIDSREEMGSFGTMAPEMSNQASDIPGYKFDYADIYSLGKTIWIILNNDRRANMFTTYFPSNVSSKLKIENVHDGIVMAIEKILNGATRENYLERMSLNEMMNSFIMIRDGLLGNEINCNNMKLKCLLEESVFPNYDFVLINDDIKIMNFLKKVSHVCAKISLADNKKILCLPIECSDFSFELEANGCFSFAVSDKKFIFEIKDITIDKKRIYIKTNGLGQKILGDDIKYFNDVDSFVRKYILTKAIDDITKVYLDCEIFLDIIE